MARRMTDKEQSKWEAKVVAVAQGWFDKGYELSVIGQGIANRYGLPWEVKGDTLLIGVQMQGKPQRIIATFTK